MTLQDVIIKNDDLATEQKGLIRSLATTIIELETKLKQAYDRIVELEESVIPTLETTEEKPTRKKPTAKPVQTEGDVNV